MLETGLLEQPVLLLTPRQGGEWDLLDVSGRAVGFAWSVQEWNQTDWESWCWPFSPRLNAPCLAVHEQQDEPLVFTLQRLWGFRPWFEVLDAEYRRVGLLLGSQSWDRRGRRLAVHQGNCFLSPEQEVLAELDWCQDHGRLKFSSPGADSPFTRMMLLASALLDAHQEPPPHWPAPPASQPIPPNPE